MNPFVRFLKNWTLPISMSMGIVMYFLYANIPFLAPTKPWVSKFVDFFLPTLTFFMLFLAFCKIEPRELRPHRWQFWLILIQMLCFALLACALHCFDFGEWGILGECAMACLLCPTATACAVVTSKLGGSAAAVTTYTILINIFIALFAPILLPLAHPIPETSFFTTFWIISGRVFPVLICPLIAAWVIRYCFPWLHRLCTSVKDLAFYLWAIALSLAIAVTCKTLVHSGISLSMIIFMALITLVCCVLQFAVGKKIGGYYGMRTEGGQSIGQKNTVFMIWFCYTFLNPVTAVVGGIYSVCHNTINTWQLYQYRKEQAKES